MSEKTPDKHEAESHADDVTANPQPTEADRPPIPQPPTDGFPAGEEDLTSRVPGEHDDVGRDEDA